MVRNTCTCPGPGSSDYIRFSAACEPVKIVTADTSSFLQISSAIFIASDIAYILWRGGCAGGPYGPGTGYDPGDTITEITPELCAVQCTSIQSICFCHYCNSMKQTHSISNLTWPPYNIAENDSIMLTPKV